MTRPSPSPSLPVVRGLRLLARRGLEVTLEHDARIDGCGDVAELERWFEQAFTALSTDEALT